MVGKQNSKQDDSRNLVDEFKNLPHQEIVQKLDQRGVHLEIAIENLERDFNMGTIVRSANAFGVRKVHIIGRRQWNKRGAMMTDKYLTVVYHSCIADFLSSVRPEHLKNPPQIIAIENNVASQPLRSDKLPEKCILAFGSESSGLSEDFLAIADQVLHIQQLGSTRSINVGVAAGIAIYQWLSKHHLGK